MKWLASAPANIALIKYMGKTDTRNNIPTNASLSYTLDHLRSFVEIEVYSGFEDRWEPLLNETNSSLQLDKAGQVRYLKHLAQLKQYFGFAGHFIIRSTNNFPHNAGIASSASSFAALTICACQALCELTHKPLPYLSEQARLSAQGSGSSCRSFFQPWALWQEDKVIGLDLPYSKLLHQVIIVEKQAKAVSSSEAHQRVASSLLFEGRAKRAETRLANLLNSLKNQNWQSSFEIMWQEFWDMHALFETANPPFGYLTADTLTVLAYVKNLWQQHNDGPLVTIDAGPNVHLLFRPDQYNLTKQIADELKPFLVRTAA
jgi:diphosphomevalonate decarboxylase